jgi:hypothetical protein
VTTPAQAFAAGLNLTESSRQRGYVDGLHGIWAPSDSDDRLSYSLGHAKGIVERACCEGCAPVCKSEDVA